MDLSISCLVFVYWTPPAEPEEGEEPDDTAEGLVWMAADVEHLPTEIQPIEGVLSCPGAETKEYILDGHSAGPFHVKGSRGYCVPGMPAETCLLSKVRCQVTAAPEGYEFRLRDPFPLAERGEELGGCELHRLTQCPVVIGYLKPLEPPPLQLALRTSCCDRGFCGATISHNCKEPAPVDENDGLVLFKRTRRDQSHEIEVFGVPPIFLPGLQAQHLIRCHPYQEVQMTLDVTCKVWIYWVPPEEPDEPEEGEEADEMGEGMLFVCGDPEQIPDEAQPLACQISCPEHKSGSDNHLIENDGTTMGPFEIIEQMREMFPMGDDRPTNTRSCMLGNLMIAVPEPPEHWVYRNRCPSPLQDRCEELGGCEMQRLLTCPQVMGYFKYDKKEPFVAAWRVRGNVEGSDAGEGGEDAEA